ncbi:MAG: hypothetical protein BGO33_07860 [Bacteroidia bacterium 43-41]|nr:MAG: hypothetical protein BGO33_07860 [Bacteroidia bacterium 43-41]
MDTYFFIPGNKLLNVNKIKNLGVDEIIIDLEDAVKASDREIILAELISGNENYKECYIRIPLYDTTGKIDNKLLLSVLGNGYKKLVFPKVASAEDFTILYESFKNFSPKIILFVETPRLLLEAKDLLLEYAECFSGIAVGSHDFMNVVRGVHSLKNLEFLRLQILYLARMINVMAIDIASMELQDTKSIIEEIKDGAHKGFDAKLFIHPNQIKTFKSIDLYSPEDLIWARKVSKASKQVRGKKDEFNPVIIDGKVIEKPHLKRAEIILNYYKE